MERKIGDFKYFEEPFEWSDDSNLEVFAEAIEEKEEEVVQCLRRAKRKVDNRNRYEANDRLYRDYFADEPKFDAVMFEDRYHMNKLLFLRIVRDIESRYEYFQESYDARLKKSFTAIQKCTSAIRQLATGNPSDDYDEYLEMAQRTSCECLQFFCDAVVEMYAVDYLHRLTTHDILRLHEAHEEKHHIPGMISSLGCTQMAWKTCPVELRGQYKRANHEHPTIMMEATTSTDLWIWHTYFGPPGSNNEINVLMQSPLFLTERNCTTPKCPFTVNGRTYRRGYYLTDGIYSTWSTFVKAYKYPTEPKEKRFKKLQESARKDVEWAFGVLKQKWGIISLPFRQRTIGRIINLVYACVIMHNMIIQDVGRAICPVHIQDNDEDVVFDEDALPEIRDEDTYFWLRFDLTEHISRQHLPYLERDDIDDEDE